MHHPLRQHRQRPVELREDLLEDRHEEQQHRVQHDEGEHQHDRRVDHRPLDAPLELRLLLDLHGNPVEHHVEDPRSLARLDHRDEQLAEDLRVTRHRLRQQQPALDILAQLGGHLGEVAVARLLLQHDQGRDDVEAGLDHRRELPGEDLQRLRFDPLERRLGFVGRRRLGEAAGDQALLAELLARGVLVGRQQLARKLDPLRVDRAVRVRAHCSRYRLYHPGT